MECKKNVEYLLKNTNFVDKNTKIIGACRIGPYVCVEGESTIDEQSEIKNSFILNCKIGKNCIIFGCYLKNSFVADNCVVINSVVFDSTIQSGTSVGPFAYLREGAIVGQKCRIGDFVEIKKSQLGEGAKAAHLCYIGDALVGNNCNIGCGCVFANYDGIKKHKTVVGDNCFLGANVNLVAPINVGNNCFVGAGTTLREDLDKNTFVVGLTAQKVAKNKNSKT